ncbi:spermatogenesis-associated protein 5-like protein 1 isoform X1, partial [Biomphalaria pfeifferi]
DVVHLELDFNLGRLLYIRLTLKSINYSKGSYNFTAVQEAVTMISLYDLVMNTSRNIVEATAVHLFVVVKDREKYVNCDTAKTNLLCKYCQNMLLNTCVSPSLTLKFSKSRLSELYGISHIIIQDCKTSSGDHLNAFVTYQTFFTIKKIQSEDFYDLTLNPRHISLGGIDPIIEKLCSIMQWNKCHKSLPHRTVGVLLHGPSGCGKSSLGKFLAQKCEAAFINIEGSEILLSDDGSGSAALSKIFSRACLLSKEGSVILFLDELDMLCPAETNASMGSKQITNALITEMDNLYNQNISGVLFIGATSAISNINSLLRRSGRFDQEVLINVPTKEQRALILEVLFNSMTIQSDISLSEIALWTPGYVGSDLKALCEEALCHSSRSHKTALNRADFLYALHRVVPSLRKSSNCCLDIQQVSWDEIGGLEEVKCEIRQSIEWPFLYPEVLKSMDLSATKGVLLYGAPGCCKTTLVRAAATSCHVNFISLNGAQIYSPYVGESERIISETFQKARALSPCILFFDEIESLVGKRTSAGKQSRVQERILSTMLNEMDGIGVRLDQKVKETNESNNIDESQGMKGFAEVPFENNSLKSCNSSAVIVIGATNRPDMIDSAILRPGRMDKLVYVPPPDEQSRRSILKLIISSMATKDIDITELSKKTEYYSGADLKNLCKEAGLICLRENSNAAFIYQAHFVKALEVIKPSLNESILQQYNRLTIK